MNKDFEKRLKDFHNKLPPELRSDYRLILDDFASFYFDIGEIFKQTCIDLIPSKVSEGLPPMVINNEHRQTTIFDPKNFKPQAKPKGNLLAEMQHNLKNMKEDELKNLIQKLQSK